MIRSGKCRKDDGTYNSVRGWIMDLSEYEKKYVRIKSIYGDTYKSQIESIEENEMHGTAELRTEQLTLRRHRAATM